MKRKQICLAVFCAAGLAATSGSAALLLQWDFNDQLGNQTLTDSVSGITGSFSGGAYITDGYDAPSNGDGGWAGRNNAAGSDDKFAADTTGVLSGDSFTVAGWYRLSSGFSGQRMMANWGSGGGFDVYFNAGKLDLRVNGTTTAFAGAAGTIPTAGEWTYLAVSYDGSASTDNVKYYIGDGTTLSLDGTQSLNAGALTASTSGLYVGNYTAAPRSISGSYDNIRVWTGAGTGGVADLATLTTAMQYDDVIPEPATLGLVGLAGSALLALRRFRTV